MSMQQTSLIAFESVRHLLSERQRQVYLALMSLGEATNKMVSERSGIPINVVTARIFELRRQGLVIESYKDKCPITGSLAIFWSCYNSPQETEVNNISPKESKKTPQISNGTFKKGGELESMYV